MPYMMKRDGDKVCVHKQNADGSVGESLHCYTGANAEEQCKQYMKALYANAEQSLFSFTELSAGDLKDPIGLKKIDGLAAGTFTSMSGAEVTFDEKDFPEFVAKTQAVIESTRTERGEIVGLPIDMSNHDHKGGAGWIVGVEWDKPRKIIRLMVNWTQAGIDLIKANMSRFFSPSVDMNNKVILGGSLTNWPATRLSNTGQLLLRPVELSQSLKEIDMPKTLEEIVTDLKSSILEAIGRKPDAPANLSNQSTQPQAPALDGMTSPTIQELLGTDEAMEQLSKRATELAQDAIRTEKRKLHVMEFAAKIAGGTKDRPFGIAVQPKEIIAVLMSLPEKQARAVELLLEKTLDRAVDFAQYGFDADGYIQKPQLDEKIKPLARQWVKAGHPIAEFFTANPELGEMSQYNLAEFEKKES